MSEEVRSDLEVLWTSKQVAKYLHVSPITVYRWIETGRVFNKDKIIKFNRHLRIPRSEVERIAGIQKGKIIG